MIITIKIGEVVTVQRATYEFWCDVEITQEASGVWKLEHNDYRELGPKISDHFDRITVKRGFKEALAQDYHDKITKKRLGEIPAYGYHAFLFQVIGQKSL